MEYSTVGTLTPPHDYMPRPRQLSILGPVVCITKICTQFKKLQEFILEVAYLAQ